MAAELIGAGLLNCGNTCFLNAILQCLLHTVPLIQAIRSLDHRSCCSSGGDADFCSPCALQYLMDMCQGSSGKVVTPDLFVQNLTRISSLFKRFQQEDAHEFLQCLLDNFENCCKKHHSLDGISSIVRQNFGGRLCSVIRCCDCGRCSETRDPMLDLSLEIEDVDGLYDALASFTRVERVDDPETKFSCEGCNSRVSVEKQLKLDQVPLILVLHLKRFKNDGGIFDKIDKHVGCPMELDLKPFIDSDLETKFDLYAVVVHSGWSSYSGHYYCFIRSSPDLWHKMDDDMVTRVSEDDVSDQQAYILFYIRKGSSPWYSSLVQHLKLDAVETVETKASPSSVLDCLESFHSPSCDEKNNDCLVEESACVDHDLPASDPSLSSPVIDNISFAESQSMANGSLDDVGAQAAAVSPPSTSAKERLLEFFDDEFLNDEEDTYDILPRSSKEAKPPKRFKPCGRMNETVNRQLRQMDGPRRQALMACLPGPVQNANAENNVQRKRLHPESLGRNEVRRLSR